MKISIFALSILLFVFSSFSFALNDTTFSLKVTVDSLRNSNGIVQVSLYNKEGSIPDEKYIEYFKQKKSDIVNSSAIAVFDSLPKGTYAINILHDEDTNGKIKKNFIIPAEGIGFSNFNSIGFTNRPNFKKASFKIISDTTKIVKIIYW